jgi:hypothetical protein
VTVAAEVNLMEGEELVSVAHEQDSSSMKGTGDSAGVNSGYGWVSAMQTQVSAVDLLAFKTTAGSRVTGCPREGEGG